MQSRACIICQVERHGNLVLVRCIVVYTLCIECLNNSANPFMCSDKHMLDFISEGKGKAHCQSGLSVTCASAVTLPNGDKPITEQLLFSPPSRKKVLIALVPYICTGVVLTYCVASVRHTASACTIACTQGMNGLVLEI